MSPSLQPRDLALLFYTWQSRYVAQRQLRLKFWPQASQATVAGRLVDLKEAKLLKTHALPWLRDRVLYSLALGGARALIANGFSEVTEKDIPKAVSDFTPGMKHDLELVDLRIGCESTGHIACWTSEHELRLARRQGQGNVRIPDGLFEYEVFGGRAKGLLEYERIGYRRTKFNAILSRLKNSNEHREGTTVFFVCPSPRRAELLRQWASEYLPWTLTPTQIQFGHYEAIKAGGLLGGFVDLNSQPLLLPELAD